ncbi:MAG: hypothetical protein ACLFP9_00905 [Desulfonatronovibrio sp.]
MVTACGTEKSNEGIVARVNGSPVFLKDIESGYDSYFFEWSDSLPPSVQEMKNTYGKALLDLILIELIKSELSSVNLTVTDDQVLEVENEIRKDYPEDEFEKMLVEEYIDLYYWRTQIRHKLLWERFQKRILLPEVNVELDEVEEYYYSNIEDFYIPDRLTYLYLGSGDNQLLEKAINALKDYQGVDQLKERFSNIVIASYEMPRDQLPPDFAGQLEKIEPGQATAIVEDSQGEFYALYLVGHKEEQLLKPHQVYSIIEQEIMNRKLANVFNSWLSDAFNNSTIEINKVMLENLKTYEN